MARFPLRRPRRRRTVLLLLLAPLALLLAASLAIDPLLAGRAKDRLQERFGDVRAVELHRPPLAFLTGAPVRATVALGDAQLAGGAPLGLGGDRVDELDLTADSLQLRRIRVEDVHLQRDGDDIRVRAIVPPQQLRLAGRTVDVAPQADGGALILRPQGLPMVPELRVAPSDEGVRATVIGGPLDGRSLPFGAGGSGRSSGGRAMRLDALDAASASGGVAITARLTREDA